MALDNRDPGDLRDPMDPRMNSFWLQVDVKMRSKSMALSQTPRKVYGLYAILSSAQTSIKFSAFMTFWMNVPRMGAQDANVPRFCTEFWCGSNEHGPGT